jgi:mono/diheme cytochrome c family protein
MHTSAVPSYGRKSSAILLRGLPLAAALLMLTPVFALGEEPSAPETPAATETTVTPGTVSSYTDDQALRGKKAYKDDCSVCHGTTLGGNAEIPALVGTGFRENWFVGSPQPFVDFVTANMPQGEPGSLDAQTYADISAYLMSRNHVPAGDTELPPDEASLTNITLPPLN